MEPTREAIAKRIAELEVERARFVEQANKQIAFLNGAIQALQELIAPEPTKDTEQKA